MKNLLILWFLITSFAWCGWDQNKTNDTVKTPDSTVEDSAPTDSSATNDPDYYLKKAEEAKAKLQEKLNSNQ